MSITLLTITLAVALFFAAASFGKLSAKANLCYQLHRLLTLPFYRTGVPPILYSESADPDPYFRVCRWLAKRWIPEYFQWCQNRNGGRGW